MRSDWNFDTIKTMSAMGTFRGTIHELSMAPGMVEDEESVYDDSQSSIDTGAATKGSDPISPAVIGMNSDAAHSTVIIKPIRTQEAEPEEPSGTGLSYAYYSKNMRLIYFDRCTTCLFRFCAFDASFILCRTYLCRWCRDYPESG